MRFWKPVLLALSSAGLYSVAKYSAEVATDHPRKPQLEQPPFWAIAHRGFAGKYPENTMLSFEKAAEYPIDAIELDVHTTRDGRIVVIHDATLDRTTDRSGRVFDFLYEDLRRVDAGYHFDPDGDGRFPFRGKGIQIPLLEDVFKRFPEMKFVVEIKQTMPAIEEPLYRLIRKYRMEDRIIVASEHTEPLERFRIMNPAIATNFSGDEARKFYKLFRLHLSNFYHSPGDALQIPPFYKGEPVITKELVDASHRKGLIVHIWTVNEPQEMQKLIDCGVDGIISDFPDRLLEVTGKSKNHGHHTA